MHTPQSHVHVQVCNPGMQTACCPGAATLCVLGKRELMAEACLPWHFKSMHVRVKPRLLALQEQTNPGVCLSVCLSALKVWSTFKLYAVVHWPWSGFC